jgi:hypothetical protein
LLLLGQLDLLLLPALLAGGQLLAESLQLLGLFRQLRLAPHQVLIAPRRLRAVLSQLGRQELHLIGQRRLDAANAFPLVGK